RARDRGLGCSRDGHGSPALTAAALGATRGGCRRRPSLLTGVIADEGEPVVSVGHAPVNDVEEVALDLLGDGSPAAATDGELVDAPHGRDLGGRAGEEDLV